MQDALIDTAAWVEFFRGRNEVLCNRVEQLVSERRAGCNGMVLGELLYGARGPREAEEIRSCLCAIRVHADTPDVFVAAAALGADLRRRGHTIPLSDCVIAVQARRERLGVVTGDRHFIVLAEHVGIEVEWVPPAEGTR